MNKEFYYSRDTFIINYTSKYINNFEELASSNLFSKFLDLFLEYIKENKRDMYNWLGGDDIHIEFIKDELIKLSKLLTIFEIKEIDCPIVSNTDKLLEIIEEAYHFWRMKQRYSIMHTRSDVGYQIQNFIEADNNYNELILNFYRTIQQKVQGYKNRVYRQLQAGTHASILLQNTNWNIPSGYEVLKGIPFISEIMLRTPLIFHPKSNKRLGMFSETNINPLTEFVNDGNDWICYPCKVGTLLTFCYFHKDFISSAVACPNLFELATKEECLTLKPDCIVLFGNPDNKNETVFFHDEKENIFIGKISSMDVIEYFGYVKKMFLTLHNLCVMKKGYLPIHGAMVKLHLRNGKEKNVMFMGDSGAGKSETIEALSSISKDIVDRQEIIFDDMGSVHIDENGEIVAQGTEIGAFVRLDDLERGSAYKDMDRSIFFNPEISNARVVVPTVPYKTIVEKHKVDCFVYANNYTDKRGMNRFLDKEDSKTVFIEGKRFALGTTQEKGLSSTFFANPFGPMQKQEIALPLIDKIFDKLFEQNIYVGEIYTCLGLENKGDNGILEAANSLLEFVSK